MTTTLTLIAILTGVWLGILGTFVGFLRRSWVVPATGEALIITGPTTRLFMGKGGIALPILHQVSSVSLAPVRCPVHIAEAIDKDGRSLRIEGEITLAVPPYDEMILVASRGFSGLDENSFTSAVFDATAMPIQDAVRIAVHRASPSDALRGILASDVEDQLTYLVKQLGLTVLSVSLPVVDVLVDVEPTVDVDVDVDVDVAL